MPEFKTTYKTVKELLDTNTDSPLPLSTIPNTMGINLSSVEAVSWQETPKGQLTYLTIHFLPAVPDRKHPI